MYFVHDTPSVSDEGGDEAPGDAPSPPDGD
jgi:hypothetical protein